MPGRNRLDRHFAEVPGSRRLARNRLRLRREPFGGLVYDPDTGMTLRVDREAMERIESATAAAPAGEARRPEGPGLSAPEVVHWAVTYGCNADCPDCYAARHRGLFPELSTAVALKLVDKIADWGAFQLAIGGGEPLLRDDLPELVHRAASRGLSAHVTTGGELATRRRLKELSGGLSCLQIGVRHRHLLGPRAREAARRLRRLLTMAEEESVSCGANVMLCRSVLANFEEVLCRLFRAGFRRVTLLRYKRPASAAQWERELPGAKEMHGVEERIARALRRHPGLAIRLDCALSFLQRRVPAAVAERRGLRGCAAGQTIAAVAPDGSVYPCSQLVAPQYRAGSILEEDPNILWQKSAVLRRIRGFRESPRFLRSSCGTCRAAQLCGGCRALAGRWWQPDPGCPRSRAPGQKRGRQRPDRAAEAVASLSGGEDEGPQRAPRVPRGS